MPGSTAGRARPSRSSQTRMASSSVADANARDNRGKTALAMATEGGHKETEQVLRKAGVAR